MVFDVDNKLQLTDYEKMWLPQLSRITSNDALVKFIIDLDDIYMGLQSFTGVKELPGYVLTSSLIKLGSSHKKFIERHFMLGLYDLLFFRIGVKLACDSRVIWNPLDETLKTFIARHENSEVIYFENEIFEDIIFLFQKRFSKFAQVSSN